MKFNWHPDQPPPVIEAHSYAKLEVLRSYLKAYFDKLNANPSREEFKLDLIDGFAGGGLFHDDSKNIDVPGSPLIMLEEYTNAKVRLNQTRNKPLRFDCKFYFTDKEKKHTDHLQQVIANRGYTVDNDKIIIKNASFEQEVDHIIELVKKRQPRAGRSIFLLDQTGFSQVPLS